MILVDSSVWIAHLRKTETELVRLLEEDAVLAHAWVIGELSLGSMAERAGFLSMLSRLPRLRPADDDEIFELIERKRLHGRGIGWVDAGLLAACLARPCRLWTFDKRLAGVAGELGLA